MGENNLGFVPTMGGIHKGHISLIKKSISQCHKTIVTIYVNKQQFNKKKDFLSYPRELNKDISAIRKLRVDYLYLPKTKELYPSGYNKKIKINSLKKKLCGKFRPGHFNGVVDVIDRFIKTINPSKIYLGEKDMQQLKLVEDFIKNNHKKVKVIGCKTIREKNGLALSSRNIHLSEVEIKNASKIYKYIKENKKFLINNKHLLKNINIFSKNLGISKIDYIKVLDINRLIKPYKKNKKPRIFIAYYLNKIRLIDNI